MNGGERKSRFVGGTMTSQWDCVGLLCLPQTDKSVGTDMRDCHEYQHCMKEVDNFDNILTLFFQNKQENKIIRLFVYF